MKNYFILILMVSLMGCAPKQHFNYPETRKDNTVDNYFGTDVPDPYRWLEDDRSEETGLWVKAENAVTDSFLNTIPYREAIKERLTKIWNYPKMGIPFKEKGLYFYSYNNGLQNQSVIYVKEKLEDEGRVFMDPNTFSEDGTVALTTFNVSNDGKYVGYGLAKAGSDWNEFRIRETGSGNDLDERIEWIKFSGLSWYKDGFFYSRFAEPKKGDELKGVNENSMVYYHKAGTPQSADVLIYKNPEHPEQSYGVIASDDEKYLIITATESTSGNMVGFRKADRPKDEFTWVVTDFENDFNFVGTSGDLAYFVTNCDAPMNKLVAIDLTKPDKANWIDIIPERENEVFQGSIFAGGKIIAEFQKVGVSVLEKFEKDGTALGEIELPGIGTLTGLSGKDKDAELFYAFTSFSVPPVIYKYDVNEGSSELFYKTEVDFTSDNYETKQVFFTSKDGTSVPMFIVHKKGLDLNGKNPTMLYGYGGFNITYTPVFSPRITMLLEQGGVYALAGIRGGGEYGKTWHEAGTVLNKQNVFDDFIAAAEYLIAEKYTSSKRLVIYGGSNGGLLVGAVTNQRPDLFAVAVPAVGVMDMLRFHKFTIGRYWTVDYGSSDDSTQFEYLYKYSPLHNISEMKDYPAVLVLTGDHDDRVVPAHSFKYIATLQDKYKGDHPVMVRIETDAGHGAGKPTTKQIEEYTDIWSFIFYNMNFTPVF